MRALSTSAAAWSRAAAATRECHYAVWGADVLVTAHSSKLVAAVPLLDYTVRGGQKFLPLNVIVFFLGRLGWVEDRGLAIDLASGLSPATLASFEAWAVADGWLDWSPTSETGFFLQRVLTLAAELATGALPAQLKVTVDSFVPFEGHDDSAGGPDWTDSWQSRMTVASLSQQSILEPYADVVLLLGPMLREDVRTDPGGRPMLVAETLASWSTTGSLSGFVSVHRRLPLLVSEALKDHVLPIELSASIMAFPAMLRDLGARLAWSDAAKRPSVLIGRFPCALHSLPVLDELLDGEAETTKYDTACLLLHSQLPKVAAPSLAALHQPDRHIAAEGFDLSGDTAEARIGAMAARDERDDNLRAAAPYGGTGGGGSGGGKTALEADPKARLHIKAPVKVLQVRLNGPDVRRRRPDRIHGRVGRRRVRRRARGRHPQPGAVQRRCAYLVLPRAWRQLRGSASRLGSPLRPSRSHPGRRVRRYHVAPDLRRNLGRARRPGGVRFRHARRRHVGGGVRRALARELRLRRQAHQRPKVSGARSTGTATCSVLRAIELERCKSAAPASIANPDHQ